MKLFYRDFGEGPPLIILHGLYGSSDNWVTIAKKLSVSFRVLLPDQRNHGQSLHSDTHDYNSMRDDLFELTEDLKLRKFFLAGHSMGGKTAISFAMKWPEMLNGLLIADISPFVNEKNRMSEYLQHQSILKSMLSLDLSHITSRTEADFLLMESIPSEKIRGFIMKNLQRSSDNVFSWKINVNALFGNLDNIMEGYDRNAVFAHQITGFPVVFLKGSNSDYIQKEDYNDIKKLFPAAEFVELADAGHWIHADSPDEVIKNIKKLLEDS
jgi:esterase